MSALAEKTALLAADRLVVLSSLSELYATKRIRPHPKTGRLIKTNYGSETHFRITAVDLSGFDHFCHCLDRLTQRPFSFVVRGAAHTDHNKTRRLCHEDPESGERATFTETARFWFAVDIDKVKRPVAIDPVSDPDGVIEYLLGLLSPELHDAWCWWQFTCSQSLPDHEETLSARLWFWSSEPLDCAALTRWARSANKAAGFRLVDDSLYRVVQPHYTAHPIFDGMRDPLPRRHGVRIGLDKAVSLVIPEPAPDDPCMSGGYVGLGVEHYLAQIGTERGFRAPLIAAIASYFGANGAAAPPGSIKGRVREAIQNADPGGRSAREIQRYCSDKHLDDIVAWVRAHERSKPVAARASPAELCDAVALGDERASVIRGVLRQLLRQRYLNPHLALALAECFNDIRCSPPLPGEQVRAIANAIATREIAAARKGGGGGR